MPAARMSTLVYVVDDQPEVLETVLLVLQSIDPAWRVEGFTSATAALAAVKTQPPDLVLSDHRMPEMPGGKLLDIADQVATRKSPPDSFAIPHWNAKCLQALRCEPDLAVWQRFGPAV